MVSRIVVVPCLKDSYGIGIPHKAGGMTFPPHGYHHILEVGAENSHVIVAAVLGIIEHATVMAVAKVMAEDLSKRLTRNVAVEMNQDFYQELWG